jgi:hypothetical protein
MKYKANSMCTVSLTILGSVLFSSGYAQDEPDIEAETPQATQEHPMTSERLAELILKVDEEAEQNGSAWFFYLEGLETVVVYDVAADRMRILIAIGDTDELKTDELLRLMQANFDSALDARYAIAQDVLWGVYIHPLSTLTDQEFLVGLGQTANVVLSYGTSYSSGLLLYGGGDSAEIERNRLIESLKNIET